MPPFRRRSTAKHPTTERRIHFFRADAGADASGRPLPLDLNAALDVVNGMPLGPDTLRYWARPDGERICMWVFSQSSTPQRLLLGKTRSNALPQSERAGVLDRLPLRDDEGISELIHVSVYPANIIGVDFNFYGPRPSLLPSYLAHVTKTEAVPFKLEPLMRHDVVEKLDRFHELRWLELHVRPSYVDIVKNADRSIGDALDAAQEGSGAGAVGVFLRPEPYGRTPLKGRILDFARLLAGRNDLRDNTWRFNVKGVNDQTGKPEEVDILQDQLLVRKKILRVDERSRGLNHDSAFAAIDEAYEELREQLESATSVSFGHTEN